MANQLLPDVPKTIFRPHHSGDSRRAETSQFDMVQAFHVLAQMPVLALRLTIKSTCTANYVANDR